MGRGETADPSTALRSGRDDNSVDGVGSCSAASLPASTELSSRQERARISYFALLATPTRAALREPNGVHQRHQSKQEIRGCVVEDSRQPYTLPGGACAAWSVFYLTPSSIASPFLDCMGL